ncbi:hypothetical protein PV518_08360 [Streptomyces sp. ND04-05B]|nr:hypothetical protein [Streptomyces sp. ND04-05B]MDX3062193.1 hypothetical protein [Streptomyces sp. ND04-05B]
MRSGTRNIARLSPLKHRNLDVLGRCSFAASTPAAGDLRPLRDPDAAGLGATRTTRRRGQEPSASPGLAIPRSCQGVAGGGRRVRSA